MNTFKSYQHRRIMTTENKVANGDYIIDSDISITIRVKNGLLDDGVDEQGELLPAIETEGATHIEHWKNGVLHCENGPAVIDTIEDYKEWWLMGKQIQRSKIEEENHDEL